MQDYSFPLDNYKKSVKQLSHCLCLLLLLPHLCRSSILKEIEAEEQHRKWFYRQLEHISKKLENLPLKETVSIILTTILK